MPKCAPFTRGFCSVRATSRFGSPSPFSRQPSLQKPLPLQMLELELVLGLMLAWTGRQKPLKPLARCSPQPTARSSQRA